MAVFGLLSVVDMTLYGLLYGYHTGCSQPSSAFANKSWHPLFIGVNSACVCCFWAFPALLGELGVFSSLFGLSEPAPESRLRLQSVATRRASLPCTIDVSRPRTRDTTDFDLFERTLYYHSYR